MYFKPNVSTQCDFYKIGHYNMYHPKMSLLYSNLTCRNDKYAYMLKASPFYKNKVVVFGVQLAVQDFLITSFNNDFFKKPKEEVIKEYSMRMDTSLGKDVIDTDHIAKLYDLGYLPIRVKAIEEGSVVNLNVPLVTIVNTHPDFAWLVNYLETTLLNTLWKPITVATVAHEYKKIINHYANKTSDNTFLVDFIGHDFSMRGQNGIEDAMISGAAFLTSFKGTDSISSLDLLEKYYGVDSENYEAAGFSVRASEHSIMTSLIMYQKQLLDADGYDGDSLSEAEYLVFKDLLERFPTGILSLVSDQYDYWNVIKTHLPRLKDIIMARDGKLVIRPDSGNMVDIVCGEINDNKIYDLTQFGVDKLESVINMAADIILDDIRDITPHGECGDDIHEMRFKFKDMYYDIKIDNISWNRYDKQYYYIDMYEKPNVIITEVSNTVQNVGTVEALWNIFGGDINSKGYKELDSHIGLIIGDGNTIPNVLEICERLSKKRFSTTNVVYGIGAYSLNGLLTRDTFGQAFKSTYCEINDTPINVYKDPKTDVSKKSAKGLLRVELTDGEYILHDEQTWSQEDTSILQTVFLNGHACNETNLYRIRNKLNKLL